MQTYWVWYAMAKELSLRQKLELLEHFSNPEAIYQAARLPGELSLNKDLTQARKILQICERKGIGVLSMNEEGYPTRLRNIADPPLVLYYKGTLPLWEQKPAIGVVGTRKASRYGRTVAKDISAQITQCGGLVVSGAASGIDACALEGALEASDLAVGVLGCGVDIVYPTTNRPLFMKLEAKGCLISEYPPGTKPKPWQFPERNRIISGISNGVLVVEAPQKSGALITARDAAAQGRDVFVIPGNIDQKVCAGSNALLRDGGMAVFSGWDVLREYQGRYPDLVESRTPWQLPKAEPDKKDIDIAESKPYSVIENTDSKLTEQERKLLSYIHREQTPLDQVIAASELPPTEAMRLLMDMALRGLVANHPGRMISRK